MPADGSTAAGIGPSWPRRIASSVLIVGSAWPAPLGKVLTLTVTGDRLVGIAALVVLAALGIAGRVRWTLVHTALGLFVAVQVLTSALNASAWPQGLKFVTVYVLGFACFALAAEWTRGTDGRRWMVGSWLAVAALVAVVGTVEADRANFYQEQDHTGVAQFLFRGTPHQLALFAPKVTFEEWNVFSSFLLVPFALGLWAWRRDGGGRSVVWAITAIVFGLVTGVTRAAWLAMTGIAALWCALRRPGRGQIGRLILMLAAAALVQALALGTFPIWYRLTERSSVEGRFAISRATIASWLERPVLGHGAGSINRLTVVLPSGRRLDKIWNGNLALFVLHDSGLLGLAALLALSVTVCRRSIRTLRHDEGAAPEVIPLLVGGGALCFASQFTHGSWLMYPYVYLGLLTAVIESGPDRA